MERSLADLVHPAPSKAQDYDSRVEMFVEEVVRSVAAEMGRQPASMVYEIIRASVERRLPGIEVDQEPLREAAARIAAGVSV